VLHFRGCSAAAPLKPTNAFTLAASIAYFRGCSAAAPLKQQVERTYREQRYEFPRLFSRGSIEANHERVVTPDDLFPRLFSRGSIEAHDRRGRDGATFRFPRLFSRGSIEAGSIVIAWSR